MKFKDYMISTIGYENYIKRFPSHYSEIEIIKFVEDWHELETKPFDDFMLNFGHDCVLTCYHPEEYNDCEHSSKGLCKLFENLITKKS